MNHPFSAKIFDLWRLLRFRTRLRLMGRSGASTASGCSLGALLSQASWLAGASAPLAVHRDPGRTKIKQITLWVPGRLGRSFFVSFWPTRKTWSELVSANFWPPSSRTWKSMSTGRVKLRMTGCWLFERPVVRRSPGENSRGCSPCRIQTDQAAGTCNSKLMEAFLFSV